jgi:nucleotide-binding universal stress UspA family protein
MKTKLLRKVLIAIDYNASAENVAETGYYLAKIIGAEVFLLHVVANYEHYAPKSHIKIMGFAGYSVLKNSGSNIDLNNIALLFLENSKKHLQDETIQTLVETGDFADTIIKVAKDINAEIIVLGANNQKKLLSSVTQNVLNHSLIPVLVIPNETNNSMKM